MTAAVIEEFQVNSNEFVYREPNSGVWGKDIQCFKYNKKMTWEASAEYRWAFSARWIYRNFLVN